MEVSRMKSDVITIDNQSHGFDEALEQTKKSADFRGISHLQAVQLQLMTEEMLSMARSITGNLQASFWAESEGQCFSLNLTTKTVLDKEKRALLISASTSRKNAAATSFLGKLRDAFEEAMTAEADHDYYELPTDVQADIAGRVIQAPEWEWDGYERSVLFQLADNVKIGIRGSTVSMTVIKDFAR